MDKVALHQQKLGIVETGQKQSKNHGNRGIRIVQEGADEDQYYIIKFIYREHTFYCIWYTNIVDGFILNGKVLLCFDESAAIKSYCIDNNINISDESEAAEYNLDALLNWTNNQEKDVDCKFILNFWNIMIDVSNSVQVHFLGIDEEMLGIHAKLFYGNNGELYIPVWSRDELQKIDMVMKQGMSIIENVIFENVI